MLSNLKIILGNLNWRGWNDYFIDFSVGELANYFLGKVSKENLNIYLNICKLNLRRVFFMIDC